MEPILINHNKKYLDQRGYFFESYKHSYYKDMYGIKEHFVQDNHSYSIKNTIRGMHYQWDKPMGKLVRVCHGSIIDVVIDIRKDSSNYGKHYAYALNSENLHQLYVPAGFAHGFICLSDDCVVLYKCTAEYNRDGESGINPFDQTINIKWGIEQKNAVCSEKDLNSKSFLDYNKEPKF